MKKSLWLIIPAIVLVLYAANPSMADFKKFAVGHLKDKLLLGSLALKEPVTVVDDTLNIKEDSYLSRQIQLKGPTEVTVSTQHVSGPPVDIYFVEQNGFAIYQKLMCGNRGTSLKYYADLSQQGGTSFTKSSTFNEGTYYFIFDNSDYGPTVPPLNLQDDTCRMKAKVTLKELGN